MSVSRRALAAAVAVSAVLAAPAEAGTLRLPGDAHLRVVRSALRQTLPVSGPAGDFNGDGVDDVIIGVPAADPLGRNNAGSAFVIFGSRRNGVVDVDRLGAAGVRIDGRPPVVPLEDEAGIVGEALGTSVTAIGDVNADGLDDIALGAVAASVDEHRIISGAVHVVFGRREPGTVDLAELGEGGLRVDGPRRLDVFAQRIAGLPGREPAIAIGAEDRIHLVPLTAPAGSVVDLGAPLAPGHVVTGYDRGDFNPFYASPKTLRRLAPAGDVDGDGNGDLLVGMAETDVEGVDPDESTYQSTAFVVLGGGPAALPRVDDRGLRIDGVGGSFFPPIVSIGDAVEDGPPDLLVGATGRLVHQRFGGKVHTYRTYEGGPATVLSGGRRGRADLTVSGRGIFRLNGWAGDVAAGPGDVDGDRRGDIALAGEGRRVVRVFSSRSLREGSDRGRAGRARPLATILAGGRAAATPSAAGDFDGDGLGDLLLARGRDVIVVSARRMRRRD